MQAATVLLGGLPIVIAAQGMAACTDPAAARTGRLPIPLFALAWQGKTYFGEA